MAVRWLEIMGLRGFATTCHIDFAIPTGNLGSGLTVILGPNNSGKSTVVEALMALSKRYPPSFSEGRRNSRAGGRVEIIIANDEGQTRAIRTVAPGGSETVSENQHVSPRPGDIFVVPSRRTFNPFFGKSQVTRESYSADYALPSTRGQPLNEFTGRIFTMQARRSDFNRVLADVLDPVPEWTIELADHGGYYLKFDYHGQYHHSDGLGEGLLSLFFIVDALYDSQPGSVIAIDEPELSLHPSLQRRLAFLIARYSKDRQIIIATHSPYFLDWNWVVSGAGVVRMVKGPEGIQVYQLGGDDIRTRIRGLIEDLNNPHVLGLDAREVFFLQDKVILVEGQEDVMFYKNIMEQLGSPLAGHFYGWGVGGAGKMVTIATILHQLGYKKVVGLLDRNSSSFVESLRAEFPGYCFFTIPADDVRSKPPRPARDSVLGLVDENGVLRPEYRTELAKLWEAMAQYFAR